MLNKFLYKSYSFFYVWGINWRRRFTGAGLFAVFILMSAAITGIDTSKSLNYQFFSYMAIVLLISILYSVLFKVNCEIKRDLPKYVTVKVPFQYAINIKNNGNTYEKDLLLFEQLKDPRPDFKEFLNAEEPDEGIRNAWDRKTLYFRWLWLIRKNLKMASKEQTIETIPPGGTETVTIFSEANSRGYIYFDTLVIDRPDPFRLFKASRKISSKQKLLVLPERYRIPEIHISGNRKYHSGGIAFASSIGNTNEFLSLREYRPGDSMRNIHWKSWAKTGELIIKEYQDEFFTRHALILDTFDEKAHSRIFEEAVSIAASFACMLESEESILDLMFVGDQAYTFSSGRGLASTEKLLEILATVPSADSGDFSQLNTVVENLSVRLSSSICIFIQWDEKRKRLLEILTARGIPFKAMLVTDNRKKSETKTGDCGYTIKIIETGRVQEDLLLV